MASWTSSSIIYYSRCNGYSMCKVNIIIMCAGVCMQVFYQLLVHFMETVNNRTFVFLSYAIGNSRQCHWSIIQEQKGS